MVHPIHAVSEPEPTGARTHGPLAAALGNASLLGVGYLMLGRRELAVATGAITLVLVSVLFRVARPWCEVVLLLWWVAVVAHGWFLARGRRDRTVVRGQRLLALGAACAVLLPVGFARFDAAGIERDIAEAHARGDCSEVPVLRNEVRLHHRVVGAVPVARGDGIAEVCDRLLAAGLRLESELDGEGGAPHTIEITEATAVDSGLKEGFDVLASALADPGNEKAVGVALNAFLDDLPADDPCRTVTITDWLGRRHPGQEALDRYADTIARAVARTEPAALVGCGDALADAGRWEEARDHYRRLLDRHPDDARTDRARKGVTRATRAIELANVRSLLAAAEGEQPAYCSTPAKYGGAAPYRKGKTNRALFGGPTEYTDRLPDTWRTDDPAEAVLVVCVGESKFGTPVRTCPYEPGSSGRGITNVTFHKIGIPVKAYELRTGKLVADRTVEIGGTSCPGFLTYYTFGDDDSGPPPDRYITPSKADVRAGFASLITR
ncbi:tetratricopeptide repeat protein [Streptomyces macrosporus]|uniref:Tetratricopeptide repeat protein n=1 Tax=Streptomyces macrosporus TaxID=44032 RepID=A0ABP5WE19_9ACTN